MGRRLREIRQHLGETQAAFGARFSLQRHDIANYERGRSDLPSHLLGQLDELGFSITWLVLGNGQMNKTEQLLTQFRSLSEEYERLTHSYHQTRDDLLRMLSIADKDP